MTRVVLFDLDGTLVDTAQDLGLALNEMRVRRGLTPVADGLIRSQASHGARGLLRIGFGLLPTDDGYEAMRQEFLDIYAGRLTTSSSLFPGMAEVLETVEAQGLLWGVVTNKPARFTEPLLGHLGLCSRAACVVSGDTCANPKPHPAPLLHACKQTASRPQDCLYVGDAQRDVEAATAAGMPTLVALYGYIAEEDRPREWGARGYIDQPLDLLRYLDLDPRYPQRQ